MTEPLRVDLRRWWHLADHAEPSAFYLSEGDSFRLEVDEAIIGHVWHETAAGWWQAANTVLPEIVGSLELVLVQRDLILARLQQAAYGEWETLAAHLRIPQVPGRSDWHSGLAGETERWLRNNT